MKFSALLSAAFAALALTAAVSPAFADYRAKAEEQTDYIQKTFYVPSAKRYRPSFPVNPKELPYDFMWGNGVQFSALVGAARHNPAKYRQVLYDFREGLQGYWDPAAPVPGFNAYCSGPGGDDKYYDDNEWLVLGFAEAYEITRDPLFLQDANNTQKFVLSGWDAKLGGGIYWKLDHKSKNTCSNAPASASALRLVQVAGQRDQLAWATKIRDWTNARLLDTDGLYWDNVNLDGRIEKHKWSYNTALMIATEVLLYQTQNDKKALAEARRLADAGLAAWTDPATGSFQKTEDAPRFTHLFAESLLRLYDATKDVRYLNAVRRHASYAYRTARDPKGGYWSNWKQVTHAPDERKILIENASAARLFWLLAPYPDTDELRESAKQAANLGQTKKAEDLLRQAAESDTPSGETAAPLASLPASAPYASEINAFAAADKKQMPPPGAVLFIGSSSIRLWDTLSRDFAEIPVINRGFGGSLIQDSTRYADRIAIPYRPKMIVLCAGTNDLAYGNKKPPEVLGEFQDFVAKIRASLPDTRIVYISINPTVARWQGESAILETNHLIEKYIHENGSPANKLNFINSHAPLLTPDGQPQPALLRDDKLHFNADGYKAWAAIVKPRVLALAALEGVARLDTAKGVSTTP